VAKQVWGTGALCSGHGAFTDITKYAKSNFILLTGLLEITTLLKSMSACEKSAQRMLLEASERAYLYTSCLILEMVSRRVQLALKKETKDI
jgi:hypothetical protein